jgi:Fe-S-cluster containining protein
MDIDMETESIVLLPAQAIEAIQIDFRQYAPQWMLFNAVLKLITDQRAYMIAEPSKNGAWLHEQGRSTMRWLDAPDLIAFMCRAVARTTWTTQLLATVCSRVFQNRAVAQVDPQTGQTSVRIHTGMEAFVCRQCGRCCRTLDYHDELTADDMALWRRTGRDDIVKWVGTFTDAGRKEPTYRIWMTPGTRSLAETCPFLEKVPTRHQWICAIHAVKPAICRNYPVSRKHATMTGCPGFQKAKELAQY